MGTLEAVLLVLLIVDALALTVLVLLQQGKGVQMLERLSVAAPQTRCSVVRVAHPS